MGLYYNWLGVVYIKQRNFEILVMYYIDGGILCISRKICALRIEIL
jgi:hypothetical protein